MSNLLRRRQKRQFRNSVASFLQLEVRTMLTTFYYVNDGIYDPAVDHYTTAAGDSNNSGLTPDRPRDSIQSILDDYTLGPDSTILIDDGTYVLTDDISVGTVSGDDSGDDSGQLILRGPTEEGSEAIVDRAAGGATDAYGIRIEAADYVTIEHLSFTGGYGGLFGSSSFPSDFLTIRNNRFFDNLVFGVNVNTSSLAGRQLTIAGNQFTNNRYGVIVGSNFETALIHGNDVSSSDRGIWVGGKVSVERNSVSDSGTGVYANSGGDASQTIIHDNTIFDNQVGVFASRAKVVNNQVFSNATIGINAHTETEVRENVVFGNSIGVFANPQNVGSDVVENRLFNNSDTGLEIGVLGTTSLAPVYAMGNQIYSNATGLNVQKGSSSNPHQLVQNIVYDNQDVAIRVERGDVSIRNNSIYQLEGDALRIDALEAVDVRNNILSAPNGFGLKVEGTGDDIGLASDYNIFQYSSETGFGFAKWGMTVFDDHADWFFQIGADQHSQMQVDPQFVDLDGPDDILGYEGGDFGADDDFHLVASSPAIDAGDPELYYLAEPNGGGGRVNIGAYGNTNEATEGLDQYLQVISPSIFDKHEADQVEIEWRSWGLGPSNTTALIDAGNTQAMQTWGFPGLNDSNDGWLYENYRVDNGSGAGVAGPIDIGGIQEPAATAVYQSHSSGEGGIGSEIEFEIPLSDGVYEVTLHFADSIATPGVRVFDVLANGVMIDEGFDIAAEAGAVGKAVVLPFAFQATNSSGLALSLFSQTDTPAILSGIEIVQATSQSTMPRFDLLFSSDHGQNFKLIDGANQLSPDRHGRGAFVWDSGTETAGNAGKIRVLETGSNATGESVGTFLISNAGGTFFVNDVLQQDDVYSTAAGDDLASGKSPDEPLANLSALLRAYELQAGDTVFIDAGNYELKQPIEIGTDDAGTLRSRLEFVGPGTGDATATFTRGDQELDQIFLLNGTEFVSFSDLDITNQHTESRQGTGFELHSSNDISFLENRFSNLSVAVSGNTNANNILFAGNTVVNSYAGVTVSSAIADNWSVVNNNIESAWNAVYLVRTLSSVVRDNVLVGSVTVGNLGSSIYDVVVENNTLTNGDTVGIQASNALVRNNKVSGSSFLGILAIGGAVDSNMVFDNPAVGIRISGSNPASISNNLVFNNDVGIEFENMLDEDMELSNNQIVSNEKGVFAKGSNRSGQLSLQGNLIYENQEYGIHVERINSSIVNNTIVQTAGNGIEVVRGAETTLFNNIIAITGLESRFQMGSAGAALQVEMSGNGEFFNSESNLFSTDNTVGGSVVGIWNHVSHDLLSDWQVAIGTDDFSIDADPGFVDPNGSDNQLGVNTDGRIDDNFELQGGSPAIDAGIPNGTLDFFGRERIDDPGSANRFSGITDIGAFEFQGSSNDTVQPFVTTTMPEFVSQNGVGTQFDELVVSFNEALNYFDANAIANFKLQNAGDNGILGDADDVELAIEPSYELGSQHVTISITEGELPPDRYRITLRGSDVSGLHDLSGLVLDGADIGSDSDYIRDFVIESLPIHVPADALNVTTGFVRRGGLEQLEFSDNLVLSIQRSSINIQPVVEFELTAVAPSLNPGLLNFVLEASVFSRGNVTQMISLFNYQTGEFELVDSRLASRFSDLVVDVSLDGDLTRFLTKGGEMKSKIRFQASDPRARFSANVDQAIWTVVD